jgi:glycosyltransferase involved in cell wall biosynthesis
MRRQAPLSQGNLYPLIFIDLTNFLRHGCGFGYFPVKKCVTCRQLCGKKTPMRKIAVYLGAAPEGGGAFQYALVMLKALSGMPADDAEVCCFYKNKVWARYAEDFGFASAAVKRPDGLERLRRSALKRLARLRFGRQDLRRQAYTDANMQIAAWKPDIVISTQPDFFIMPETVRQIAPIHDLMHIYENRFPEVGTPEQIADRNRMFSGIARYCSIILVDSELGGEHVLRNFPASPEQIRVLPFAAPESLLTAAPQRPGGDIPTKFMLYPAQFWEHKNHARLLEAMATLKAQCPDLHCVFCGSTRYSGYTLFTRKVTELGLDDAVTVLGYVSETELAWLYRNARCLLMPTFFGPTNIPPLEAMALGCPLAVSDVYAMREQCGDAALYFNPSSVLEMAEVMRTLWENDIRCAELREKGREKHILWNESHVKDSLHAVITALCA